MLLMFNYIKRKVQMHLLILDILQNLSSFLINFKMTPDYGRLY
jgi:hypothetical protein